MEVSEWKRYSFRKSGVERFKLDVSQGERTIEERQSSLCRIVLFPSFPRDIQQYLRKSIRDRGDRNNRGIKVMRTERRRRLSSVSTRRSTSKYAKTRSEKVVWGNAFESAMSRVDCGRKRARGDEKSRTESPSRLPRTESVRGWGRGLVSVRGPSTDFIEIAKYRYAVMARTEERFP